MNITQTRLVRGWISLTPIAAVAGVLLLAGCAGTPQPPKRSGFLYNYDNLQQVDDTTWRYVNTNRLALYRKFEITTPKILATQYDGKPITEDQKERAIAYIRGSLTKALEAKGYSVVSGGYGDVAEIRVAITDVYKTGSQLGLTVEGSVVDAASAFQAAAVMKTELAPEQAGSWWDNERGREIIDRWSARLAEAITLAHQK